MDRKVNNTFESNNQHWRIKLGGNIAHVPGVPLDFSASRTFFRLKINGGIYVQTVLAK